MTQPNIIDPQSVELDTTDVPYREIPEKVLWSEIAGIPPQWRRKANPVPVPGGALFIVEFRAARIARNVFQVTTWDKDTGEMAILSDSAGTRALYGRMEDARSVRDAVAASLREANGRG